MYTIHDNSVLGKRILQVYKPNTKIFTVNGEIVKIPENGMVSFPIGTQIVVNKMLHFVKHNIDMAINRSELHHNAVLSLYGIGQEYHATEAEKIKASLEVVEKYD